MTTIPNNLFGQWLGLTSVTLLPGVTSIGANAFNSNPQLAAINVSPGNPNFSLLDGVLFNGDGTVLIRWPVARLGVVAIPPSVTTIGESAFNGNQLTSIVIPASVTSIGNQAFNNNPLASITIGSFVNITQTSSFTPTMGTHGVAFLTAYSSGGWLPGTYTFAGGVWTRQP